MPMLMLTRITQIYDINNSHIQTTMVINDHIYYTLYVIRDYKPTYGNDMSVLMLIDNVLYGFVFVHLVMQYLSHVYVEHKHLLFMHIF